jgi:cysteine-rich repeat protein
VLARVTRPDAPANGDALGMALAPAGVGVIAGAPGARAAFVFPNLQEPDATILLPPVAAADDGFGARVAAPDGLAVVGAPRADGEAGVAYVFDRSTGAAGATLRPATPVAGAHVGAALASSGALALVGAPGGAAVPGQAFLFDAATGALLQTLRPDPSVAGDEFGVAVGFAGADLVIGAPGALEGRGRVDRFDAATGAPTRSYAPPSPTPGDRFGAAIAVDGTRLVIGAPGGTGAAYVFDLETGVLEATLQKPMPEAGDGFGSAVALEGTRVFVGAPGDDAGTLDGGTTYVFDLDTMVAALRNRLSADGFGASAVAADGAFYVGAPAGAGGDGFVARIDPVGDTTFLLAPEGRPVRFGASLAALGDLVVVGAPESPLDNGARVGAVHLFDGTALRSTLQNPSPGDGDEFGFAVGGVDGDILASAPFAGDSDTGLVYRLDTSGRLRVTYGKPAPTAGDFFGAAIAGDQGQVLVGAPLDASGGPPSGAVYLFDAETASIVHTIASPNETPDLFGAAVALGQWIVVGAPRAPGDTGNDGTVWVFDRATAALVRRLENPRFGPDDFFGSSVALLGDQLLVGAPLSDDRAADTGIVYLFEPATGQLVQTFRNPPQGPFDNFGFAVAAGGAGLLVGSPGPSRVYVFDPIATVAALRTTAPLAAVAASQCGNGLVEADEACDDGNDVDTDDCRSDCTPGPCCTLDALADASRCDDANPCTTDSLDPVLGCRYEPSGAPGCCESDADCPDGQCRLCVGCFVYRWDCCEVGSTCVPSNPECVDKTCLDAAYCQCEGKLDCGGEEIPAAVRDPFAVACNTLRLQVSVAPEGTVTKPELVLARQATRSARASLRKTIRTARAQTRAGALSRECRKQVVAQVKVVRQAIPRGRRLRRCLGAESAAVRAGG